jgi:hypothetical protein
MPADTHRAAQGWFNLARARYQMGAGAVGRMQYDNNMAADVRLTASAGAQALASRSLPA